MPLTAATIIFAPFCLSPARTNDGWLCYHRQRSPSLLLAFALALLCLRPRPHCLRPSVPSPLPSLPLPFLPHCSTLLQFLMLIFLAACLLPSSASLLPLPSLRLPLPSLRSPAGLPSPFRPPSPLLPPHPLPACLPALPHTPLACSVCPTVFCVPISLVIRILELTLFHSRVRYGRLVAKNRHEMFLLCGIEF